MKTKKQIEILLENGIHFKTIINLTEGQINALIKRFNKPINEVKTERKTFEIQTLDPTTVAKMRQDGAGINVSNGEVTPKADGSMQVTREIGEKFESKAQQALFWNKCTKSTGKTKRKWCNMAKEFSSKTDFEKLPKKKHPEKTVSKRTDESYERFLEDRIFEMLERHVSPTMTKSELLQSIKEKKEMSNSFMLENPKKNTMFAENEGMEMKKMKRPIGKMFSIGSLGEDTKEKEAPTTPKIKPKKKNPHRDPNPDVDENPKADQKEKERTITKPGIKPKKPNPHRDPNPDVDENPKAEKQKNQFISIISTILNNN
jgi:hypothetical protein